MVRLLSIESKEEAIEQQLNSELTHKTAGYYKNSLTGRYDFAIIKYNPVTKEAMVDQLIESEQDFFYARPKFTVLLEEMGIFV